MKRTRMDLPCKACGKIFSARFYPKEYSYSKYCSHICHQAGRKKDNFEGNCETCGKHFVHQYKISYVEKHPKVTPRFCSMKCMYKSRRVKKVKCICQICEKEFYIFPSDVKLGRGKFCSKLCNGKYHTGEKSQVYKHGLTSEKEKIKGLPEYRAWRTSVFIRDGRKCVLCGSKKDIQADHIKPQSLYPEFRYDINNGRTLCFECHTKTPTWGNKYLTREKFEAML